MSAFFVTATGTDIGKTFVTAGLIRHLRGRGEAVSALKPVVSGFSMARAEGSDPGMLLAALGEPVTQETVSRLSPWRYEAALSPDMAAAREGTALPYDEIVAACRRAVGEAEDTLFIEGVGGVMVPLDGGHTVRDWMVDLGLPVLLVAGSYLGTISHTLTALETLKARGLTPMAIALNDTGNSPVELAETEAAIARFAPEVPIIHVPRDAGDDDFAPLAALLRQA
jgi:dethiobiotin synthetase